MQPPGGVSLTGKASKEKRSSRPGNENAPTPPLYEGRDPDTLEEANALYKRYIDAEISLSEKTIEACLARQEEVIDRSSPPPPEASEDREVWQHPGLPDEVIEGLTAQDCYSWLDRFDKTYHLRVPGRTDLMDLAGLREVVRTLARTPSLRNALELEARETREKQYRGNFAIIDTRGVVRLNYQGIADHLLHKYDTVTFSDQVYVYDPSRGIYRPNEGELEAEIGEICRTIGYEGSVSRGTREVLYYVMYPGPPVREYPFNKCEDFIPVMNGIVKIDYETGTRTLLPHSPENKVTFVLPVEYRPEADPGPIQEVLAQWVREEDIPVLAQIPSQGLLQMQTDETYKRSYVFQGEYNAGKSTYLKFLQYVLGEDSITHVSLQGITEDRFASGKLENKILNIYDDLPDQALRNTGIFKALTGSTHHSVERKNKQAYDGRIFAVHVFSCNRPPQVPEEALFDPAFWERWCYVSFPFFFALDPTFEEVLLTPGNASAFLNVVIDRMVEIRQGKSLVVNLSADQVRDRWIEEADPLAQFIKTKFERTGPSERHDYDRDKFFSELSKWYESEGIPPKMRITTLNALTRDLMKFEFLNKKNSMSRGGRKFDYYAYKGPYQWREESSRESMRPEVPGLDKYLGGE